MYKSAVTADIQAATFCKTIYLPTGSKSTKGFIEPPSLRTNSLNPGARESRASFETELIQPIGVSVSAKPFPRLFNVFMAFSSAGLV